MSLGAVDAALEGTGFELCLCHRPPERTTPACRRLPGDADSPGLPRRLVTAPSASHRTGTPAPARATRPPQPGYHPTTLHPRRSRCTPPSGRAPSSSPRRARSRGRRFPATTSPSRSDAGPTMVVVRRVQPRGQRMPPDWYAPAVHPAPALGVVIPPPLGDHRPLARVQPQSVWPTSTGSLTRVTPKASCTPSRTVARQGRHVGCRRRPAVGHRQRVLGRQRRRARHPEALGEAGLLDQPRGAGLDVAVGVRRTAAAPARPTPAARRPAPPAPRSRDADRIGLVKNDPQLHVSWSAASSTIPRRRRWASTASRASAERHPRPHRHPELRGEVGVAHRLRHGARDQLEHHVDDDVPVGGLEHRVPVGEPAVERGHRAHPLLAPVPHAHPRDGLRDLLAVGADVLHRRRPGRPRDAGQRLDARPPLPRRRAPRSRPSPPPPRR